MWPRNDNAHIKKINKSAERGHVGHSQKSIMLTVDISGLTCLVREFPAFEELGDLSVFVSTAAGAFTCS